jgi:hypothetical protein
MKKKLSQTEQERRKAQSIAGKINHKRIKQIGEPTAHNRRNHDANN